LSNGNRILNESWNDNKNRKLSEVLLDVSSIVSYIRVLKPKTEKLKQNQTAAEMGINCGRKNLLYHLTEFSYVLDPVSISPVLSSKTPVIRSRRHQEIYYRIFGNF
jgi:hypothetical protein